MRSHATYEVRSTAPPPSLIVTRFATAPSDGDKFRLDVSGTGSPDGKTVTRLAPAPELTAAERTCHDDVGLVDRVARRSIVPFAHHDELRLLVTQP